MRRSGSIVARGGRKGLLALGIAGTLLLCHGVYGAAHQLHLTPGPASLHASAHPTPDSHASHDSHGGGQAAGGTHPDGDGEGHPASSAYAAALAVVLLGAFVVALLRGVRSWARTTVASGARRRPPFPALALPRGSPSAVSQVFRL